MVKREVLRHGVIELNNKEMPGCPECNSTDFDFERVSSTKLKFPTEGIVLTCIVCGCIWRLSRE